MKLNKGTHTRDSDSFSRKTLQEYKNAYFDILDYYKSKNIDNDEESFIDYEIRLIKEFIKPVVENIKTELEIEGIMDLKIELEVKPFISSYIKIMSFLETKKVDIYKEQGLPILQTENKNLRDKLFEINKKNYLALEKEYEFTESDGKFIYRNFWPIIVVNSFDAEWIKSQLDYSKTEFIKENKVFNVAIFKRNITDFLISEIKEYLDNLQKGKTKVWTERKGDYFHWFKLQFDTKSYTLLISDKNEIQLEIYFTTLLSEISKFIENEQALPIQQIEPEPELEITKTLSVLITHTKSVEIVKSVKVQYKNIKGKRLKILLLAFQDLKLLPIERTAQKFHECCKKEFDWNIASYNAMNGYNFNESTDNVEFTSMKQYLETLIKTN